MHGKTHHHETVWAKGKWCSYIFDESQWRNTMQYIERHNIRRGLDPRPYTFVVDPSDTVKFPL